MQNLVDHECLGVWLQFRCNLKYLTLENRKGDKIKHLTNCYVNYPQVKAIQLILIISNNSSSLLFLWSFKYNMINKMNFYDAFTRENWL